MADKTGYIGRNPGDSNVIIARQTYRPTGVQTSFSFNTGYTPGYLDVYLNGSKLVNSLDYKATSGGTVEITDAPISGDIVEIVAYKAYSLGTALDSVAGDMSVGGDLTATNATISGTVTAGIGSFDAFTFDNLLVSGISTLTGTANIGDSVHTGVATFSAAGDFNSTISVAQTATFSSDVSIAGTLTYEDVTNIDSVGLITAQSGIRVSAGSSIGIGVDDPAASLQIKNTSAGGDPTHLLLSNVSGTQGTTSSIYFAPNLVGTIRAAAIKGVNEDGGNSTALTFFTNPEGNIPVERVRIDSAGNVGIGTDNPDTKLHIEGNNPTIKLLDNSPGGDNDYTSITHNNGTTSIDSYFNDGAGITRFRQGSTEALRITVDGAVGIGTENTTGETLRITKQSSGTLLRIDTVLPEVPTSVDNGQFIAIYGADGRTGQTFSNLDTRLLTGTVNQSNFTGWRAHRLLLQGNDSIHMFAGGSSDGNESLRINSAGQVSIGVTVVSTGTVNDRIKLVTSKGIHASHGTGSNNDWNNFWGSGGPALVVGGHGYLGTNGSFGLDLVSNGYRNTSNGWTSLSSYNGDGTTRSIISLRPITGSGGGILFGSDSATSGSGPTIRGMFNNGGAFIVSTDDTDGTNPIGNNQQGFSVMGDTNGGGMNFHVTSGDLMKIGKSADGNLIRFFKNTGIAAEQGNISMASGTVSYNPFLGCHTAVLTDWSTPDIKQGTIMDTINESVVKLVANFTVDGEEKRLPYNGNGAAGDTVTVEYNGDTYNATLSLYDEVDLNKHVKVKVNDTAGSKAVYGVFLNFDPDEDDSQFDAGHYNDMKVAAVGNYFIRIASGQTPEIGDLIESNGSGCGVVQSDDIIRSKTVGKITSTTPQRTYDDGTFLLTAVLYCG